MIPCSPPVRPPPFSLSFPSPPPLTTLPSHCLKAPAHSRRVPQVPSAKTTSSPGPASSQVPVRPHHPFRPSPTSSPSQARLGADESTHHPAEDTPFEGGVFQAELKFPRDYPLSPPKVRFLQSLSKRGRKTLTCSSRFVPDFVPHR